MHVASVCFKCFKCFKGILQVCSYGYCKSRSGCCIRCNGYTRMLQVSIPNVSSVFRRMLQVFFLDVAYVSHICCKRFIWMLHVFLQWPLSVFMYFCKCFRRMLYVFQLFHTYVAIASVLSECCKSRSDVAHVAIGPTCRSHLLQLLGRRHTCVWEVEGARVIAACGLAVQMTSWNTVWRSVGGAGIGTSGCQHYRFAYANLVFQFEGAH
jgi:hypothetical protein